MARKISLGTALLGVLLVAPAAWAECEPFSGTYTWETATISYQSTMVDDTTVYAEVSGTDGSFLGMSVIDLSGAEVTVGDVTIQMDGEVTEEQGALIKELSQTKEAAALRALVSALAGDENNKSRPEYLALVAIALVLGEGEGMPLFVVGNDCHGCCGPGCWGCHLLGNCYTDACKAHDTCVAQHGHLRCLGGLLRAIQSYFAECVGPIFGF